MKLILGFDLDNICVATSSAICKFISERLPVNLTLDDITTYSIEAALPEQYRWIVDDAFRNAKFWKGVQMINGASEYIEKLYKEGHEIYFVTSSLPLNLRKKINHLSRNMPFFPKGYVEKHTINMQDKYLLNIDILVDDCLDHAMHPKRQYTSIVLDYPWNRNVDDTALNFYRAYYWNEIYYWIKTIEKNKELTESQFSKSRLDKEQCVI